MTTAAAAAADPVTVAVTGPHCPACCPVARLEHDAFQRGYDLGRPRTTVTSGDGDVLPGWAKLVLFAVLSVALLVQLKALARLDPPATPSPAAEKAKP